MINIVRDIANQRGRLAMRVQHARHFVGQIS